VTTEEDFQHALDANPADWQTRLVFADWLQDRGDLRAEGYRALGHNLCRPYYFSGERRWFWWEACGTDPGESHHGCLGDIQWWGCISGGQHHSFSYARAFDTRSEAEDAAALAFGRLPPELRAQLLANDVEEE
jgi:uncharacterized protein (TIGR02996 family)